MLNKIISALEPFMAVVVILAGATLTGAVKWTNPKPVGIITVFCGILLTVNHIYKQLQTPKK